MSDCGSCVCAFAGVPEVWLVAACCGTTCVLFVWPRSYDPCSEGYTGRCIDWLLCRREQRRQMDREVAVILQQQETITRRWQQSRRMGGVVPELMHRAAMAHAAYQAQELKEQLQDEEQEEEQEEEQKQEQKQEEQEEQDEPDEHEEQEEQEVSC